MTFTHISWSQLRELEDMAHDPKTSRVNRGEASGSQEDMRNIGRIGPTNATGRTDLLQDEGGRSDGEQDAA